MKYVLTGLRASRFTCQASKPLCAKIDLANTVNFLTSKSKEG